MTLSNLVHDNRLKVIVTIASFGLGTRLPSFGLGMRPALFGVGMRLTSFGLGMRLVIVQSGNE